MFKWLDNLDESIMSISDFGFGGSSKLVSLNGNVATVKMTITAKLNKNVLEKAKDVPNPAAGSSCEAVYLNN